MNRKYTHLFFDLDNTLWNFEQNSREAMQESFNHFIKSPGLTFNRFFEIYTGHNHALWDSYRKKEIGKKELTRDRFLLTFNDCRITGVDPDEMNEHYLSVMPHQKILNHGAAELLQYLKERNYSMHIITNGFKQVQLEKIASSGLKPFFDKIFISEEIKSPKPNREIFELAVKSSNARKKSSIMIGDDWEVDVLGALKFGIDAVLYQPSGAKSLEEKENPVNSKNRVFACENFESLKKIL